MRPCRGEPDRCWCTVCAPSTCYHYSRIASIGFVDRAAQMRRHAYRQGLHMHMCSPVNIETFGATGSHSNAVLIINGSTGSHSNATIRINASTGSQSNAVILMPFSSLMLGCVYCNHDFGITTALH